MSLCRFKSKKKLVMLKTNIKSILKPHSMVFVLFSYQFDRDPNIYIYSGDMWFRKSLFDRDPEYIYIYIYIYIYRGLIKNI